MTDGKIEFKTSIDTDGVKKGIKEIDSALQGIANVDIKVDKSKINKATKEVKTFSDNLDEASDNAKDFAKSNKEANDSVDSLGEKLDKANKSTSATSKGFAGLGNTLKTGIQNAGGFAFSITNIANAGKLAADVMKKVAAAVAECTAAYRTQKQAETQLEAAAKNNPMLNGRSVAQLKEFASSVQRVSTVGDEQLLPLMAQLAAAGRTQEEIQQIIKTSVDVAASGAMSLDSAVRNLNKTYSGLSGELGETIPQIKALTTEELKQGKAIEVIAKQYKGMAEETTKATGTAQQLANAWGDFKEELGAPFEKALAPMRQFFSEFLSNVTSALSARRQLKEAYADLESGNVDEADLDTLKADYQKKQEKYNKTKAQKESQYSFQYGYKVSDEMKARSLANDNELNKQLKEMSSLKAQIDEAEKKLNQSKTAATIAAGKAEAQAKAQAAVAEAETARQTANDKAASAYAQYDKTINAKKEEIRWRKECGEAITEEAEKQEMLDTQMSAWLTMIESSEGTISGTKGKAASILTQIKADYAEVQEIIASNEASEAAKLEAEKALQEYKSAIEGFASEVNRVYETTLTPGQALDAQINDMRAKYEQLTNDEKYLATLSKDERIQLEQEYTEAYAELCRQRQELAQQEAEQESASRINNMQQTMSKVQSFVGAFSNMVNSIASTAMEYVTAEKEARLAEVQEQYDKGLISLEQYEAEKKKIEKEAAEEEYKIKMWQWTAECIQATANIASAVIGALAEYPGPLGIAMAAMVGAAGAAQLASVIASKPQPPSFATGGIVGGNSYHGDKIQANVNSGEMILNAQQQKNLFDAINNGQLGGATGFMGDVKIYNYASDEVEAKPEITNEEIVILINKTVNDSLSRGQYTESLKMAQSLQTGTRFTN